MLNRRFLMSCATAFALLAASTSAVAATHAKHVRHVSGRVVSINAARHTLRLRVKHAAAVHAASAGGGPVIVVSFASADVSGPHGAVEVGDDVSVTLAAAGAQTAVATTIRVIGRSNGGAAGKGAAVPGEVTSVNAAEGTLTLAVLATDAQGQTQLGSVIVTVDSSTILAVGDTNADQQITLDDIVAGDHVVVFTSDATADPMAAIGILDASHIGGNHHGGDDGPTRSAVAGTVTSVDASNSLLAITVGTGPLTGAHLTVKVTPQTSFGGEDASGDAAFGLADIATGDAVVVYTPVLGPDSIVALGIVDRTSHHAATPRYRGISGTVTEVTDSGLQLAVGGEHLPSGENVTVEPGPHTVFRGTNAGGGAVTALADIQVGDQIAVYAASLDGQPIVAILIADRGDGSAPSPTAPNTEPLRFSGVVTAVRVDGLTVTVTGDGPLRGKTIVVSVTDATSFATEQGTGTGIAMLSDIPIGHQVAILTTSESASPVVASAVLDQSVVPGSGSD